MRLTIQVGQKWAFLQDIQEFVWLLLLVRHNDAAIDIVAVACAGGYETSHDDVFLEAAQFIGLALERGFS